MKRVLQLVAASLAVWLVAATSVSFLKDGAAVPLDQRPTLLVSALALAVALVPSVLALTLNDLMERGAAETQVVGFLVGVFLRLVLTMALAVAVDRLVLPELLAPPEAAPAGPGQGAVTDAPAEAERFRGPGAFLVWALFFYLATLAFTTILLIVDPARAAPSEPRHNHPGAQQPSHGD